MATLWKLTVASVCVSPAGMARKMALKVEAAIWVEEVAAGVLADQAVGTVMGASGSGESVRVEVVFGDHIRRTLMARFARLQVIG